tara:strand:+ start:71 stop:559 length:489 start_codon:yes stop_codon:yes gene_type:complete
MAFVFGSYGETYLPKELTEIVSDFTDERYINRSKLIKSLLEKSEKFIMGENPKFGINNFPCLEDEHRLEVFARYYSEQIFYTINPTDSELNIQLKLSKERDSILIYNFKKNKSLIEIMNKCNKVINKKSKYKSFNALLKERPEMVDTLGELILLNILVLWKF